MSHQSHDADPSSFQDPCIYLPHRHVHEWIKEPLWHPTTLKQMHFHWEIHSSLPTHTSSLFHLFFTCYHFHIHSPYCHHHLISYSPCTTQLPLKIFLFFQHYSLTSFHLPCLSAVVPLVPYSSICTPAKQIPSHSTIHTPFSYISI